LRPARDSAPAGRRADQEERRACDDAAVDGAGRELPLAGGEPAARMLRVAPDAYGLHGRGLVDAMLSTVRNC